MKARRLLIAALALSISLLAPQASTGHSDSTSDSSSCDTWYRPGHGSGSEATHRGSSHEHATSSDIHAVGFRVHAHTGHYVLSHPLAYVEAVGGQSYSGPSSADYGQGGWAQGEIDPAIAGVDIDFHTNFFGPVKPNSAIGESGNSGGSVCITVGNTRIVTPTQCEVIGRGIADSATRQCTYAASGQGFFSVVSISPWQIWIHRHVATTFSGTKIYEDRTLVSSSTRGSVAAGALETRGSAVGASGESLDPDVVYVTISSGCIVFCGIFGYLSAGDSS